CGGIGLMTFAVAILILFRKKIGLQNRIYLQESLSQSTIGGIVKLVKLILVFALSVEAVAIFLLTVYWIPEFGFTNALHYSIFHVISAFNNAGFSLFPDNLMSFAGDPIVNIIISALFIIGGIGFTVVMDVHQKKSFRRWTLHTKLMIFGTLVLNAVAMVVIFALEYGNPGTIGNLSLPDKLWSSYFSAVTPRTAGFNS